jgi:hypothetical protein
MLNEHLDRYLASLPRHGRDLTSAEVERGQRSKQAVIDGGRASIPMLLDRLKDPDFLIKDNCYDLVLEIGNAAKPALYEELGRRGPIVDIWIVAMLRYLGDERAMDRLCSFLDDPVPYVRHLSALALAFRILDSLARLPHKLLTVLVEALENEQTIEGTPFTIAGSALGCLTRMSGKSFISSPTAIQFYNDEHFLYPPPVHPFPFAADHLTMAPEEEKRRIRQRVEAWVAGLP